MTLPLVVLALGAIFAGYAGYELFVGHGREAFWGASILVLPSHPAVEAAHHVPVWVKTLPIALAFAGIAMAYLMYVFVPSLPGLLAGSFKGVYQFLLNKWYFDELYDFLFVRPAMALGRGLWKGGDGALIDGVGPDGIAAATLNIAQRMGRLQSGYLYHYAFAMIIGVAGFVTWYMFNVG
jgi:NADH-quinone oxidoreductase subunit L